MAMNRQEKQELENLKIKLALHCTDEVQPDLPIPQRTEGIVNGWIFNSYSMQVKKSCSTATGHGVDKWGTITAQNAIVQFSTKLRALKAMRTAIELECAKKLYEVDKLIMQAEEGE